MKVEYKSALDSLLDEITPIEQAKTDAKMKIALLIEEAMQAKNLKNKDLLAAIGKENPSVISKWLSGTHNFTIDTLVELECALDISLINTNKKVNETIVKYHFVVSQQVNSSPNETFDNLIGLNTFGILGKFKCYA
jgi:transcriptional regulator with XRE-family HTH domain